MNTKTIPQIVKDFRTDHKLSQRDLANMINEFYGEVGFKRQNIGMWENGQSKPNPFLLAGIYCYGSCDDPLYDLAENIRDTIDREKEECE